MVTRQTSEVTALFSTLSLYSFRAVKLLDCIAVSYLFDSFIDSCCCPCLVLTVLLSSSQIAVKSVPCSYCGGNSHTENHDGEVGLVLVYDGFQCFSCAPLCPVGCCCVSSPLSSPAEGRDTEWGWTSGEPWAMRQGCATPVCCIFWVGSIYGL